MLYNGKISTGDEAAEAVNNLALSMKKIGFEVVTDRGDFKSNLIRTDINKMTNYNPKSLKAEEFIHDGEILETLEYAEANKNNMELINSILEKARPQKNGNGCVCQGLTHREASILLACDECHGR